MKRAKRRQDASVALAVEAGAEAIPLALAPALFVGRAREVSAARAILRDGRVLVVWGLGGFGKTSLVRSALPERDRRRGVEVRPSRNTGLRPIAEAVARAWGAPVPTFGDDEASAMTLVSLADARGATIVVDDGHFLDPSSLERLLRCFAGFASRGRLVVSSRERPDVPDLAERFLRLDALDAPSVGALVRACRPELSEEDCARVVSLAGGSPWAARCMATGHARAGARITDDLDAFAARAVGAMRWVDAPLSEEAVDRIAGRKGIGRLLEARALAERSGSTLRLHDVARDQLAECGAPDLELAGLALDRILDDPAPSQACAALILAAACGRSAVIGAIIARSGDSVLSAGLADTAFQALRDFPPGVAPAFRLACAARSGSRTALAWASAQDPPAEADAVVSWASCMVQCARGMEALGPLARAARSADDGGAHRAALYFARIVRTERSALEALALLSLPRFACTQPTALHLAVEAKALVYARRYDEATHRAELAVRVLEGRPERSDEAPFLLFCLFTNLGQYAGATGVLRVAPHLRDPAVLGRSELYMTTLHAMDTGDVPGARIRLQRFARLTEGHDEARFMLVYLRFRLAWIMGDVDEARATDHEMREIATRTGRGDYQAWARITTLQLAMDDETAPSPATSADAARSASDLESLVLEVFERLARVMGGHDATFEDLTVPDSAVDAWALHARLEGECRARRGDVDGARRCLANARARAHAHGSFVSELEVVSTDARICERAGRTAEASQLREHLSQRGRESGALRYCARETPGQAPAAVTPHDRGGVVLDAGRRIARFADGRAISLQHHEVSFRILEEVLRQGGSATKEHLVRTVWQRRTYDAARDDKRLQMAVRRLRLLIELDPGSPSSLLTTAEGYGLADTPRRGSGRRGPPP